jgi:hypothetical protein
MRSLELTIQIVNIHGCVRVSLVLLYFRRGSLFFTALSSYVFLLADDQSSLTAISHDIDLVVAKAGGRLRLWNKRT